MKRIKELLNRPGVGLAEIRVWMEALEQQHDEALNLMLTNAQRAAAILNTTEDEYAGTGCEWIEKDTLEFFHERQVEIESEAEALVDQLKANTSDVKLRPGKLAALDVKDGNGTTILKTP